jgi:carbon storage regulator
MLVLTRKIEQQIHIGNDVTITVLEVTGRHVRLGIEAPRAVRVLRSEVLVRIEAGEPPRNAAVDRVLRAPEETASALPLSTDKLDPQACDETSSGGLRRRVPSVSDFAPLIRPPQRLGPTSLRDLAAARRK